MASLPLSCPRPASTTRLSVPLLRSRLFLLSLSRCAAAPSPRKRRGRAAIHTAAAAGPPPPPAAAAAAAAARATALRSLSMCRSAFLHRRHLVDLSTEEYPGVLSYSTRHPVSSDVRGSTPQEHLYWNSVPFQGLSHRPMLIRGIFERESFDGVGMWISARGGSYFIRGGRPGAARSTHGRSHATLCSHLPWGRVSAGGGTGRLPDGVSI